MVYCIHGRNKLPRDLLFLFELSLVTLGNLANDTRVPFLILHIFCEEHVSIGFLQNIEMPFMRSNFYAENLE